MPLLKRKTILAAKQETTIGTAIALAAGDAAFNVMDATISYEIPPTERWGQGSLSKLASVPGARQGKVTFYIELGGSGTGGSPTPAWATTLLPACGWLQATNAFSPTSTTSNWKTLTIGVYQDGLFKSIKGAMGTWNID